MQIQLTQPMRMYRSTGCNKKFGQKTWYTGLTYW